MKRIFVINGNVKMNALLTIGMSTWQRCTTEDILNLKPVSTCFFFQIELYRLNARELPNWMARQQRR